MNAPRSKRGPPLPLFPHATAIRANGPCEQPSFLLPLKVASFTCDRARQTNGGKGSSRNVLPDSTTDLARVLLVALRRSSSATSYGRHSNQHPSRLVHGVAARCPAPPASAVPRSIASGTDSTSRPIDPLQGNDCSLALNDISPARTTSPSTLMMYQVASSHSFPPVPT